MSPFGDKLLTLSELDLTKIFWQDPVLKRQLQVYAKPDYPKSPVDRITQDDVGYWIARKEPGYLITRFLTDIGSYTQEELGKKKDYSKSTFVMSNHDLRQHIHAIRDQDFDPVIYTQKGYVPRGSIRTYGFRIQVLAFKLNELNAVKYRRLPDAKLPPHLTTTVGGTEYCLSEIRNIVKSKQDVDTL
ncbi:hypothetical protein BGX33_002587 [Mortierella sp. NVP41]|nr:hypothetical protein BGX33_002587 [Mortierella sp. NVP41]